MQGIAINQAGRTVCSPNIANPASHALESQMLRQAESAGNDPAVDFQRSSNSSPEVGKLTGVQDVKRMLADVINSNVADGFPNFHVSDENRDIQTQLKMLHPHVMASSNAADIAKLNKVCNVLRDAPGKLNDVFADLSHLVSRYGAESNRLLANKAIQECYDLWCKTHGQRNVGIDNCPAFGPHLKIARETLERLTDLQDSRPNTLEGLAQRTRFALDCCEAIAHTLLSYKNEPVKPADNPSMQNMQPQQVEGQRLNRDMPSMTQTTGAITVNVPIPGISTPPQPDNLAASLKVILDSSVNDVLKGELARHLIDSLHPPAVNFLSKFDSVEVDRAVRDTARASSAPLSKSAEKPDSSLVDTVSSTLPEATESVMGQQLLQNSAAKQDKAVLGQDLPDGVNTDQDSLKIEAEIASGNNRTGKVNSASGQISVLAQSTPKEINDQIATSDVESETEGKSPENAVQAYSSGNNTGDTTTSKEGTYYSAIRRRNPTNTASNQRWDSQYEGLIQNRNKKVTGVQTLTSEHNIAAGKANETTV